MIICYEYWERMIIYPTLCSEFRKYLCGRIWRRLVRTIDMDGENWNIVFRVLYSKFVRQDCRFFRRYLFYLNTAFFFSNDFTHRCSSDTFSIKSACQTLVLFQIFQMYEMFLHLSKYFLSFVHRNRMDMKYFHDGGHNAIQCFHLRSRIFVSFASQCTSDPRSQTRRGDQRSPLISPSSCLER